MWRLRNRTSFSVVIGQLTRLYADAGTEVRISAETDPDNCGAGIVMMLSGTLVDVP